MIKGSDRVRSDVDKIRNVCILAHVDHGKTTISDSLITINGIISTNSAGKLHYLDNREDEQTRLITIKSSSISIVYNSNGEDYLINLIDSPGHVDFSIEVSAAVRMCDGALFVVDAVEGICPQSKFVLRQAFKEGVKTVLVLNKIDRLITELRYTPLEIYHRLQDIIGQTNALVYNITTSCDADIDQENNNSEGEKFPVFEGKNNYYNPSEGNVIFCSGTHKWAINLVDFSNIIIDKLGLPQSSSLLVRKALWGDYYYSYKNKCVKVCKNDETPMFVEFVIKQIYSIYNYTLLQYDLNKVTKIIKHLNIEPCDIRGEELLVYIINRWIPLSKGLADLIVNYLPNPKTSLRDRMSIINSSLKIDQIIANDITLIHVAKFAACDITTLRLTGDKLRGNERPGEFVALSRVFSGKVYEGMILYMSNQPIRVFKIFVCMGGDLIPVSEGFEGNILALQIDELETKVDDTIHQVKLVIEWLHRLHDPHMVRDNTESLHSICSIERCLTLYSVPNLQSLPKLNCDMVVSAILRVSIEPVDIKDMEQFLYGLALLYTADPSVEIEVLSSGEYVLGCCGEMHLERCLNDLKQLYARVDIRVSEQLISIREGIDLSGISVKGEKMDRIGNSLFKVNSDIAKHSEYVSISGGEIEMVAMAIPMSQTVLDLMDKKVDQYRRIVQQHDNEAAIQVMEREILSICGDDIGKIWGISLASGSRTLLTYQPIHSSYEGKSLNIEWSLKHSYCQYFNETNYSQIVRLMPHVISAFQAASKTGPIAQEPIRGVVFVIQGIVFNSIGDCSPCHSESSSQHSWALSGQIISCVKQLLHRCIKPPNARIYQAMLKADLLCEDKMLGCAYNVLSMYKSQIINESNQGHLFLIEAMLPVPWSMGLAKTIRSKSSGSISYNITFYKWLMIEQDPFLEPNIARSIIDQIRSIKGLRPHVYPIDG